MYHNINCPVGLSTNKLSDLSLMTNLASFVKILLMISLTTIYSYFMDIRLTLQPAEMTKDKSLFHLK